MLDDLLSSPEMLLARAAEHDAQHAQDVIGRLSNARLLEVIVTQAQLAVEPGRTRNAGIDALAELDRAAVELMGLAHGVGGVAADPTDDLPLITGWELMSLDDGDELVGATTSLPARPWHLALIAFTDRVEDLAVLRTVTAVTADLRYVACTLRIEPGEDDVAVLCASVSARLEDIGPTSSLAWGLWCALAGSAEL
jgi:hypothetical protein